MTVLEEFIQRYGPVAGEDGPVLLATEVFGATLDGWQEETLRGYGRGEKGISIAACHGPGKTFIASVCIWHQLLTRFPQKTVVTAPSKAQLEDALVAEVLVRYTQLPKPLQDLFEVKTNRIELKAAADESFFSARTARAETPEALQGVHSAHVLLIADEASGVPEKIFVAAEGSMSGHNATTILLSNPVRTSGYFYDTHHRSKEDWRTIRVSHEHSTRVDPEWVARMRRKYGEESNIFRVRCMGLFPKSDLDTVIPLEYVESAQERDIVLRPGMPSVWGVDVARFGDDSSALIRRNGLAVLPDIEEWQHADIMQTAGRVKARWDECHVTERPEWILVDVIGLGAGVVDRLRELGLPVRAVNVSETASASEKYTNLRSELWFLAREWLASKDHKLPKCEGGCPNGCLHTVLASELTMPRFQYSSSGKLQVESKDSMKKRGHASPNIADAFIMTFAVELSTLVHGSKSGGYAYNWNKPISRKRAIV